MADATLAVSPLLPAVSPPFFSVVSRIRVLSSRTIPAFQLPGLNRAPKSGGMSSCRYSRHSSGPTAVKGAGDSAACGAGCIASRHSASIATA